MLSKFLVLSLFLLTSSLTQAAGDHDDFYEMKIEGDKFWSILEVLPYATEGQGPVMYVFEYSECPYCQQMYRDFSGKDVGIQFRKMFVPINDRTARETAALGKSRDIADYHAYMQHRKTAPAFDQDNEAIDKYNAIVIAVNDALPPILKKNGWPLKGIAFPQYVWKEDGRVFTNAGYSKTSFSKAIDRAKRGAQSDSRAQSPAAKTSTATSAAGSDFNDFDILGLRLGMPLDEARDILKAEYPSMRVSEMDSDIAAINGSRLRGLTYRQSVMVTKPGIPPIQAFGFAPPNANTISAIGRTENLEEKMLYQDLRGLLIEKYGEPTYEYQPTFKNNYDLEYILSWSQSIDGQPLTDGRTVKGCSVEGNYRGPRALKELVRYTDINDRHGIYKTCGRMLVYHVGALPKDPSIVSNYHAVLYDIGEIRKKNRKTVEYSIAEAQKIEAERKSKAAGAKKPKL